MKPPPFRAAVELRRIPCLSLMLMLMLMLLLSTSALLCESKSMSKSTSTMARLLCFIQWQRACPAGP
jgi:hypothetical protein